MRRACHRNVGRKELKSPCGGRAALIDWSEVEPWHPIMAAQEVEPGRWVMIDTLGEPYGRVRFVRRGEEVGYRADDAAGNLIGYYRTLRAATSAVHRRFISTHGGPTGEREYGRVR